MDITQFFNLQQALQLAREYWWVPFCPWAAMFLLTPLMRMVISTLAIGAIIWAVRNHKTISKKPEGEKSEPVEAEVVQA